jgi:hypothetical protein
MQWQAFAQAEEQPALPATVSESTPTDAVFSRLNGLEKELAEVKKQNHDLAGQVSDLQEAQGQAVQETPSDLGKTKVFGFFDMSFGKMFFPKSDSVYKEALPVTDKSTFALSALNVYLGNQITNNLKFLSELRFTYQPLGTENNIPTYMVLPNGKPVSLGGSYDRTSTGVTDSLTMQTYQLGGVSMERVQVTYSFSDYFGITAGRFLTPYGIWNVDHGSPVILMVRAPFMQSREMVPLKQLGIQLFGKAFLGSGISLDYAGTISNGRGPTDTVMDLDENKGLGLRWRLNYEEDELSISFGQYGYTGKYTDITKSLYVGPGSADYSTQITPTNVYTEYDLANDLLVKFHGLRLQSEAMFRRVTYQVPPQVSPDDFNGSPAQASLYNYANYLARAFYGLLAYELPDTLTGTRLRITPFVYYENFNLNDTINNNAKWQVYSLGINTRPYTNIVLKVEYDLAKPNDLKDLQPDGTVTVKANGYLQVATLQLAVTF